MSNESLEGEGKLMAVIGDEVSARIEYVHLTSLLSSLSAGHLCGLCAGRHRRGQRASRGKLYGRGER